MDATGLTKTYDGQPVSVVAEASVDGSALLYSVDGSTWSDVNPEFTNAGTYTVYVKATHDGYANKAKSNRVKHGIRFEDAVLVFDDSQRTESL